MIDTMGLGILFVGYFLLLNFAYSYFTDAIAGAVMLYALYKLSKINDSFKRSIYPTALFLLLGIGELILSIVTTILPTGDFTLIYTVTAIIRHAVIFLLTMLILLGIKELALEVDIPELAKRCVRNVYFSMIAYALNIILEAGELADFIAPKILVTLYLVSIILTMAIIALNLTAIYGAHMRIYIPEDNKNSGSKSKLLSAFEAHEEEKSREYAEYRLEKLKNKKKKKK